MDTGEKLSRKQVIDQFRVLSRPESRGGRVNWAAIQEDQRVLLAGINEIMPPLLMSAHRLDIVAFFEQAMQLPSAEPGQDQEFDQAARVLETKLAESEGLIGPLALNQPELAAIAIHNLRELASITRD
jgi:hypothetical protein